MNQTVHEDQELGEPLRVGVAGLGYWGQICVRTVLDRFPKAEVRGFDPDGAARSAATRLGPRVLTFKNLGEMLDSGGLKMVLVCVPAAHHASVGIECLESEKSVLIEKPFNLTHDEIRAVRKYADKGLTVSAGYLYVHNPIVRVLKEWIEAGTFGAPIYFDFRRHSFGSFRRDVGPVRDLMVHDLSISQFLLGANDRRVLSAQERFPLPTGQPAEVDARLTFRGGIEGSFSSSHLRATKTRHIEVIFEEGVVLLDELNTQNPVRAFKLPRSLRLNEFDPVRHRDHLSLLEVDLGSKRIAGPNRTLGNSIAAFVAAVNGQAPNTTDIDFAVRVDEIATSVEKFATSKSNGVPSL